ncbi:ATP-dependent protease ATP-binding subunit-like protein AmiB [Betaproteobacteria bacterium]|nr:ATP-dependent protease ATP-binding subunit-like protein AmiB [Betaproteobacteria bacterium]
MPFVTDRLATLNAEDANSAPAPIISGGSGFLFEPQKVMRLLRSRIVGQEHALNAVEEMLNVVKVGINDPLRPLSVNLFIGPTGTGKTETVRLIAESIHGRSNAFCRIDMNTLAQEHYAAALTGAPPGYVGSKEGITLFDVEAIEGSFSRPGIVLFDELEKASREVIRSLLNILDTGTLTLSSGTRQINFRNTLIFMTSNIGAHDAALYRQRFMQSWRRKVGFRPKSEVALLEEALHRHFEPEFLNRIDRILSYKRIDDDRLERLLEIELEKLNTRLALQGKNLTVHPSARKILCTGHDVRFGARDLARKVRVHLEPAVASYLLNTPEACNLVAVAAPEGGAIKVIAKA